MSKLTILGATALALLAGCPKQEHAGTDAAPAVSPSAEPQATTASPETPAAPSGTGPAKPFVKLPVVTIDGGPAAIDAGPLPFDSGLALLADAAPPPTPSASGSAQPAAMPPECTAYLAKADACVAKRPAALQATARAAIAGQRSAWTSMLTVGQAQVPAVVAQCKAAAAALAADPACK